MAISLIAPIILVIVLALIIIVISSAVKVSSSEGGESVLKSVYIYLVLFATLMMTIGGSVAAFMAVADIVAPAPYYQSFEEYRQWGVDKTELGNTEKAQLSEADIKVRYDAMVAAENNRQMTRAKNSLIKSLGWIIIPLPIFIYYQRRLKDKEV
jgi:hypothetical protein